MFRFRRFFRMFVLGVLLLVPVLSCGPNGEQATNQETVVENNPDAANNNLQNEEVDEPVEDQEADTEEETAEASVGTTDDTSSADSSGTTTSSSSGSGRETWVFWTIYFNADRPTVARKIISVWEKEDGVWDYVLTASVDLSCQMKENVEVDSGMITFGQGGHLECYDIDLAETLADRGVDVDFSSDPFRKDGACLDGTDCMVTRSVIVRTNLRLPPTASDPPNSEYPIFRYPMASDADEPYLAFKAQHGVEESYQLVLDIATFVQTGELDEQMNYYSVEEFRSPFESTHTMEVRRVTTSPFNPEALDSFFDFFVGSVNLSFRDRQYFPSGLYHQFPVTPVTFYIGDPFRMLPDDGFISIRDIFFDPNDSCAGCV